MIDLDPQNESLDTMTYQVVDADAFRVDRLEARRLLSGNWSWQDQQIGLDQVAANYPNLTGAGETVVLIDAGVDYNHPALGGGYGNKVIDSWNFDTNSRDTFPYDNAHGTGTAGQIAADPHYVNGQLYQGVAPGVKLVSLRADGTWNMQQALNWVLAHKSQYNIVAMNYVDFSGADIGSLLPQLEAIKASGVFMAGPIGNYGPSTGYGYPDDIIHTIGSVNAGNQVSSFTPRGNAIDLVAPGENVDVTWYWSGNEGDLPSNGTSWAAPQVTGAAALIKQINPNYTPDQIFAILRASATPVYDSYSNMTYAMLNLPAAVQLAYAQSGDAGGASAPVPQTSTQSASQPTVTKTVITHDDQGNQVVGTQVGGTDTQATAAKAGGAANGVTTTTTTAKKTATTAKTIANTPAPKQTTTAKTTKPTITPKTTATGKNTAKPAKSTVPNPSFTGNPFASNTVITAANYDVGGEGVGDHAPAPVTNGGDGYRYGNVATTWSAAEKNEVVTNTKAGQWMNYTFDVAKAGSFDLFARLGAAIGGGKFHLVIDGKSVSSSVNVPRTGSADSFTTQAIASGVSLKAGRHVLRVVVDKVASNGSAGSFEWFSIGSVANLTPAGKRK